MINNSCIIRGEISGQADLWCTYAAIKTYEWMGLSNLITKKEELIKSLTSRQNADGAFAWSIGMNSDAWATYYCTQAIKSIKNDFFSKTNKSCEPWLSKIANSDGGYCMIPGQTSDVWATYYAVRTLVEIYNKKPSALLLEWLSKLQSNDGGLTWSPKHAENGTSSDIRACYYAIIAWKTGLDGSIFPWNRKKLLNWIQNQQSKEGGFRFQKNDTTDCLWATFRATNALNALGESPASTENCIRWIRSRLHSGQSFSRWPGYEQQDVWAAFCGIGSLVILDDNIDDIKMGVVKKIHEFRIPQGGFTYINRRESYDVLSTASRILSRGNNDKKNSESIRWLETCILPNENGIMYMPGRGSEVRCTLWALCAGAFENDDSVKLAICEWLIASIQNPDGGFGFWEGRASDMVSTASAVEIIHKLCPNIFDSIKDKILSFIFSCQKEDNYFSNVPQGDKSLRSTLQAYRSMYKMGINISIPIVKKVLLEHKVKSGGFGNNGNRLPDLLSSYESILISDMLRINVDFKHLDSFINSIKIDDNNYAWTPLVKVSGGDLSNCLGVILDIRCQNKCKQIPALTIS